MRAFDGSRRPTLLVVVAAAALVAALVLAIAAERRGHHAKVGLGSPTTTPAITTGGLLPGAPGGSVEPETTVPPPPTLATTTSTSVPPASTSLSVSTSAPPVTATSPVTPADCAGGDLLAITTTDALFYATGQPVTATVTVRNNSGRRCVVRHPFPVGLTSPISMAQGSTVVWRPEPSTNGVIVNPRTLDPGGSYQWATARWNQHGCIDTCVSNGGSQVPPGIYQAVADHPPGSGPPAVFTISGP